jgi:hypothetical protein
VALRCLHPGQEHTARSHELAVDLDGRTWYLAPDESTAVTAETYIVVPLDD